MSKDKVYDILKISRAEAIQPFTMVFLEPKTVGLIR